MTRVINTSKLTGCRKRSGALLATNSVSADAYCYVLMVKQIPLNASTLGTEETEAVLEILASTRVTMGPKCQEFERAFGEFLGAEAIFVNSGSSANLLTFFSLANHAAPHPNTKRHFVPGSEVIVPAVSWSTTFWPIIQAGGVPVLIDCNPDTFQMNTSAMRAALSEKTVAVCAVHVLGNTVAMNEVANFVEENGLWLIEDTCEALGARYGGKLAGSFGDVATFSFFFSHHITTIEGGMIVTKTAELAELLRCMRAHGWTRDLKNRKEVEALYPEMDPDFLFINSGFNVRPTEINAALGIIQLKKLETLNRQRNEIAARWTKEFASLIQEGLFRPMQPTEETDIACFGYPVMCRSAQIRRELKRQLSGHGIETRPIICGNMARQPAFKHVNHRVSGGLTGADEIMARGLMWGLHPQMSGDETAYVAGTVLDVVSRL
jgi:CDP-6-deoxy-D-xylo-4-hexulose-3-dehydrase